ncbi:hypothetical protein Pmani_013694 [Petrolisthes manimaculis]|uniref:C2H2-type domain-containing protein n=1 Tax=Petrolisthes manimaculis TaxID=1843537 RepID=A0AAE1U942_9EUCA|nr:hypothetical protein Pmani_013694 [Petrolisthes manimaculis]
MQPGGHVGMTKLLTFLVRAKRSTGHRVRQKVDEDYMELCCVPDIWTAEGGVVIDSCDGANNDLEQNVTLDYVLNSNGTATCKLCGELLPSRNHWYRHKYKTHATALYRCDDCGVVYKSKKGYETHMEVKHAKVKPSCGERPRKRDWQSVNKTMEEAKRQQEEAMVSAIIARVKLECAMEGEDCSRRGYQKH